MCKPWLGLEPTVVDTVRESAKNVNIITIFALPVLTRQIQLSYGYKTLKNKNLK